MDGGLREGRRDRGRIKEEETQIGKGRGEARVDKGKGRRHP